ncbi:MAG: hypothetical protein K8R59_08740 [Thermoanaerobaculales bacterium]|nr:hypothetical protein [Thermoanaerobaculales bacterium]
MKITALISCLFLSFSMTGAAEVYVLPAVAAGVEGDHGSLWETEVRILSVDPLAEIEIRRLWVCTPEGGFLDDPETGPRWMIWGLERGLQMTGEELLGVESDLELGAVALEITGGEVLVNSYVADVSVGETVPEVGQAIYGLGQLIPAQTEALSGPSHLPWMGACADFPDVYSGSAPPCRSPYRNNIGLANPSPEPMVFTVRVLPMGHLIEMGLYEPQPEEFEIVVPPYGWKQTSWMPSWGYWEGWGVHAHYAVWTIVNLIPEDERPYYAYVSVVFSPEDPEVTPFSDPSYIPAQPGYIPPRREVEN